MHQTRWGIADKDKKGFTSHEDMYFEGVCVPEVGADWVVSEWVKRNSCHIAARDWYIYKPRAQFWGRYRVGKLRRGSERTMRTTFGKSHCPFLLSR